LIRILTLAVIEMTLESWFVAEIVPGTTRAPLEKLEADEVDVLRLLHRWREEASMGTGVHSKR
jgi:hypothetical protein